MKYLLYAMSIEEYKFSDKTILLEERQELPRSYKIRSYLEKISKMEKENIPQKEIKEVLDHFFQENKNIPEKTKHSISKIIYCRKDRIIIAITNSGKEIIWKRQELINSYGWFFFVTESEAQKKSTKNKKVKGKKKKEPIKEEKTISAEEFKYQDLVIPLKQKENMRSLYNTREYNHYLNIIKKKNVQQMPIKDVLTDLFSKNNLVPLKEQKAIGKIIYYQAEKVIVVKALIGDKMYANLKQLVLKYGWYFYITGVPVGSSDISIAIDRIEKRYNDDFFQSISLSETSEDMKDIKITLYPIALRPNHNCHVLGLGKLNILLDCGISEEDFQNFDSYYTLKKKEREQQKNTESKNSKSEESSYTPNIDAIFISQSHFDHVSGLKELIKTYPEVPILCSRITLDLFLLRDSRFLKQENHEEIEEEEYKKIIQNVIYVENGTKLEFKDANCYLTFNHAGHMPGALMILAKVKKFRFLYTGDYTFWDITPFAGTGKFLEQMSRPIDFLLIDSTCAYEEFDSISDQLSNLMLFLEQKTEYEDNCLIGADPSSLAITFMLTIWRYFRKKQLRRNYKKRPNIYVDMMVRKNIQVINHRYEYIYGPISKLIRDKANPFNSIKFRWFDYKDLDFLKTKNNIIISHPPNLSYGIIKNIISSVGRNPHNLVYLAGAIHEEPGYGLIDLISKASNKSDVSKSEETNIEKKEDEGTKDKKIEISEKSKEESIEKEESIDDLNNTGTQELIPEEDEEVEEFESFVEKGKGGTPIINFSQTWKTPFRAMLLNTFSPDLKIKLHADKIQLFEMIKILEPKEICFFHQNPKRLVDVSQEVKALGFDKISVSRRNKLIVLNQKEEEM